MKQDNEDTDEVLMAAYVDGDEQAFGKLFTRYTPRLARTLRRQVRSDEDVNELVQQTFLHLHRARRDFRQGTLLRPWLFTICWNLKREYFRKRGRRPEYLTPMEAHEHPVQQAHDPLRTEQAREVRAALAQLPAAQRDVIELHWFEDLPFAEVAGIVGASVSAVKVRAHRGYERLRGLLPRPEGNPAHASGIPKERNPA